MFSLIPSLHSQYYLGKNLGVETGNEAKLCCHSHAVGVRKFEKVHATPLEVTIDIAAHFNIE